jgi:hypothetical protein
MKTFDFAYWLDSIDPKSNPDQPPSDRFPLKSSNVLTGVNEGIRLATEKIIKEWGAYPDGIMPHIVKVEILEL